MSEYLTHNKKEAKLSFKERLAKHRRGIAGTVLGAASLAGIGGIVAGATDNQEKIEGRAIGTPHSISSEQNPSPREKSPNTLPAPAPVENDPTQPQTTPAPEKQTSPETAGPTEAMEAAEEYGLEFANDSIDLLASSEETTSVNTFKTIDGESKGEYTFTLSQKDRDSLAIGENNNYIQANLLPSEDGDYALAVQSASEIGGTGTYQRVSWMAKLSSDNPFYDPKYSEAMVSKQTLRQIMSEPSELKLTEYSIHDESGEAKFPTITMNIEADIPQLSNDFGPTPAREADKPAMYGQITNKESFDKLVASTRQGLK